MRVLSSLPAIVPGERPGPGDVDLWCFFYEAASFDGYDALMTEEERVRHARFRFERDRRMFLATRALVRTVLSEYARIDPADWRFAEEDRGKPRVTGADLEFNLTNTYGLVACVVSRQHRVGVDAERIADHRDLTAVARRHFSPRELDALFALPEAARLERFYRYWTLKESYLKALGSGLALPLDQFSIIVDDEQEPQGVARIAFDGAIAGDPAAWSFASLRGSEAHVIAVAAETNGVPLSLRAASYVPLHGAISFL